MEPTRTKIEIGRFKVTEVKLNAIRISLGQGVNVWIHMNFEHAVNPGDVIPLFTEIKYAHARPTPE